MNKEKLELWVIFVVSLITLIPGLISMVGGAMMYFSAYQVWITMVQIGVSLTTGFISGISLIEIYTGKDFL